ncbi:MAG: hypothetical protein HY859_13685 [Caulobacterales bacterium]|nr:hypothetical protein [Caulobacterales bacterium]
MRRHPAALLPLAIAALSAPGLAHAAEGQGDWIVDARLRYEFVDQAGFANEADALTLRTRLGYETPAWNGFKALVEGENVTALSDRYNSTTNGQTTYPTVLDPETTELNRAQVSWTGARANVVVGRQRIVLGNARFVGNVGFRQNEQTFDAVKATFKVNPTTSVSWIYVDRVRRILGDDSPQGEWDSDSHLVQMETKTPAGQLTAYGYLLDFETAPLQSSATWGARLTGSRPLASGPSVTWEVEYARQGDYGSNPADFDLDYLALSAGLKKDARYVSVGLERLDGNGVRGFGTPLATLHAFNGWADLFLATPANGLTDLNLKAGTTVPVGARKLKLAAAIHDFSDADGGLDYGSEIDASATLPLTPKLSFEMKAARFNGDTPAFADRTKVWVTLELKL